MWCNDAVREVAWAALVVIRVVDEADVEHGLLLDVVLVSDRLEQLRHDLKKSMLTSSRDSMTLGGALGGV